MAMQKGGVGKTTTVVHLSRGACLAGLRALVMDMDPQANCTDALAAGELADEAPTIADLLLPKSLGGGLSLDDVTMPSIWDGIELTPSRSNTLNHAEMMLTSKPASAVGRLTRALQTLNRSYDLVIIDCPPALNLLTVNALNAADQVLPVIEAEKWSLDGLALLRETVQEIQEHSNPALEWAGVIVNRWRDTLANHETMSDLAEHFPEAEPFGYRVPLWTAISESISAQYGLDQWPGSRFQILAQQYKQWAMYLSGNGKG